MLPAVSFVCFNILAIFSPVIVEGVWTRFDLVQNYKAWGSKGTTSFIKIDGVTHGGPKIPASAQFGAAVANIGDLNGDLIDDLMVGAPGESALIAGTCKGCGAQVGAGAVYTMLMSSNGSVSSFVRIGGLQSGGPPLYQGDGFGTSVAGIGDLDGDGIVDAAVGAPGVVVASVYVLFMNKDGTVRQYQLIRGPFESIPIPIGKFGNSTAPTPAPVVLPKRNYTKPYIPNGPPITYQCSFGSALAGVGDINGDGVKDIAVAAADASGGHSRVYILFMKTTGFVASYSTIASGVGGGPVLDRIFPNFGSSIVAVGDLNFDGVMDIAIGASGEDDAGGKTYQSGVVFVCLLTSSGTVKSFGRISELAQQSIKDGPLPLVTNDACGSGLGSIGDINLDNMRQHHPTELSTRPVRPSIPDLIMGCPQGNANGLPGRTFLLFLTSTGVHQGYTLIPGGEDKDEAPKLDANDRFGAALAGYRDIDANGLKEYVVGSPGDSSVKPGAGSIYILFLRRKRFHSPTTCPACYWGMILGPIVSCIICTLIAIAYFFWYFRRRADEVEIMAIKVGVQRTKNRDRKRLQPRDAAVYTEDYNL